MTGIQPTDRLQAFDFEAHNAEVKEMWAAFEAGSPTRTPVILGTNTRFSMLDPVAGAGAPTFEEYMTDPDVMFDTQLAFQRWCRFNLLQDAELGLPTKSWWVSPDFQNTYEAAWFGCKVEFRDDQVPATRPDFADCPERVMENGLPDPFGGSLATGWEYYEHFQERAAEEEFLGKPIEAMMPGFGYGSDGIMTVACNLFGADFVCTAMAEDPDRLHALFDFITEANVARVTAWRGRKGLPAIRDGFFYADDSIALISTRMYRDHVLPYHRKTFDALATQKGRAIHLCGDATRHFATIQQELNVRCFDTGFPVDFARIRAELGPLTRIQGGPHVELVRHGSPEEVYAESVRILRSGVLDGGNFVLREGNNLAPGTPPENTEAMYRAARDSGFRIQDSGAGSQGSGFTVQESGPSIQDSSYAVSRSSVPDRQHPTPDTHLPIGTSTALVPRSAQVASEPGTRNAELPVDRLAGFDFAGHNAEVKEMWAAYRAGAAIRTPIIVGTTTRFFMADAGANPAGLTFREYTEDPDVMFDAQLRFARWRGFNILQDAELGLGLPERWQVSVDFQNYWEPAWFGCPVEYVDGEVPDTRPAFDDAPERVMEHGIPDPFGGVLARGLEYHERFLERAANEEYLGRPIEVLPPWYGVGYNGPMTVACALFGPGWTCEAMALEEDRFQTLVQFITDATVARMHAWRQRCGVPIPEVNGGGMDDSVAMISVPMFKIHILPHLKRIYDTFTMGRRAVHMCGDATRHFPTLQKEIGIQSFDTGFPVDFGKVRSELGPEADIQGGPHVELVRSGTPEEVYAESVRILKTGILDGGRFTLREGNNLGPGTPLENTEAMYRAGREHGYRGGAQ